MALPAVPEGYVARYEHHRWVILTLEVDGLVATTLYSTPLSMRQHEWKAAREAGYGVFVLPDGGKTVCRLYLKGEDPDPDELVIVSETECVPGDSYSKKRGRAITLGAALKAMARAQATADDEGELVA